MAAKLSLDAPVKKKPPLALAETNSIRNMREKQKQRAAKRLMRRESRAESHAAKLPGFADESPPPAIGCVLIIHEYCIKIGMILQQLFTHWTTKQRQLRLRESPLHFGNERQR